MTLRMQADTRLDKAIAPQAAEHPGMSGVYLLRDGRDAFAARVLLTKLAERTLDVQYYIWGNDKTGTLMLNALRAAAERGVRVRLLLDDNNTTGLDEILAAFDALPNIEVRLFNPLRIRRPRWISYIVDFRRVNRRMHNKSITADGAATIIGGRNIGDKYFDANEDIVFSDLDVIGVGPVAGEVEADFERYWDDESSCRASRLAPRVKPERGAELVQKWAQIERDPAAYAYVEAVRALPFVNELLEQRLSFEWAPVRMISDDPAKVRGKVKLEQHLFHKLEEFIGDSAAQFDLVSAYFVPTGRGADVLVQLAQRGVKIRILTNSLSTNDVAAVHAGYAKRRKSLLQAGIKLRELRLPAAAPRKHHRIGLGSRSAGGSGKASISSLHAKTFTVDRSRIFIGSFNFDPRSSRLNTELGFVIDSPELAQTIESGISEAVPDVAYEVHLSDAGTLYWIEHDEGEVVRHDTEPRTSFRLRAGIWLLSLLPIDWML